VAQWLCNPRGTCGDSAWPGGCPGPSITSLGPVPARGLVRKSNNTTTGLGRGGSPAQIFSVSGRQSGVVPWKTDPKGFQLHGQKGFPFACGCTRGRTMLRLYMAITDEDGAGESKAMLPPTSPQPFQNKQAWEIIVNVKGIKKASACVRVYVCASPARLILLPIRLTAPRLITRLSALYNLISRINLWLRAHLMPGITNLIWRCTGSFIPPSPCPPHSCPFLLGSPARLMLPLPQG